MCRCSPTWPPPTASAVTSNMPASSCTGCSTSSTRPGSREGSTGAAGPPPLPGPLAGYGGGAPAGRSPVAAHDRGMNYIDELARAIRARVDLSILPRSDVDRLFRIYAVLALAKGSQVTARDVHNAWAAWECDR